ncbi:protein CANDIDATE G-PROTEIN COUPLED RECEPTOR 7 [Sesamum angolense]|uniref:Protein CANDIDATE G-PROTEIN COUPLED RECEPTOR 7 n=1 Tax=Sesamum angolense TaxID=2727404 RepID=A0AAE1WFB1_9LAMI|nr:protein CANDIDATE G-PROTEIN COUPLED RECEPTOR 7 [Sesamum angolense]
MSPTPNIDNLKSRSRFSFILHRSPPRNRRIQPPANRRNGETTRPPPPPSVLLPLTSAEIKTLKITSDSRPMILFERFGFTHTGQATIAVSSVSVGSSVSGTDPSRLGFFLLSEESLIQVLLELQTNPSFCVLDSKYINALFTFRDLSPPPDSSFNHSYPITAPNEYSLFFANCAPQSTVSMDVRTELYNFDGREKDFLSAGFAGEGEEGVDDCDPLQVLANIASIVIGETGPFIKDWVTWNQVFLLVDIICCCAVIFPIVWSIRSLRETSKTDGKAARNLAKLTLFRQFYIVVIGYLYFTRIVVFALRTIAAYKYQWVSNAAEEIANLAFYVVMFYMFRPVDKNGYFVLDEDEEAAEMALRDEEFEL